MTEPKKENRGGRYAGQGRPKGSKTKGVPSAVPKLDELGLNPITQLVEHYREICELVERADNKPATKVALIKARGNALRSLIPYAYPKAPQSERVETKTAEPIQITLTGLK